MLTRSLPPLRGVIRHGVVHYQLMQKCAPTRNVIRRGGALHYNACICGCVVVCLVGRKASWSYMRDTTHARQHLMMFCGPVPNAAVASYLPTPPARPSDVPAACKSARRRRRKSRRLQKCKAAPLLPHLPFTLTIHLATDFQQPKARRMLPLPDSAAPVPRRSDLSTPTC